MISWFEKHSKFSWTITVLIAILIFYLSSLTFPPGTGVTSALTIFYHFNVFFFFALFLSISLTKGKKASLVPLVLIISILYSFSDEIHQFFVPGRTFSVFDILLDFSGILLASMLYLFLIIIESRKSKDSEAI